MYLTVMSKNRVNIKLVWIFARVGICGKAVDDVSSFIPKFPRKNLLYFLAGLLQIDLQSIKNAVSLFCRLGLAKKKKSALEICHPSWSHITTPSPEIAARTRNDIIDDPLLKELNDALAETNMYYQSDNNSVSSISDTTNGDLVKCSAINSPLVSQKHIAFFFDSTLTAFLMMGNLSADLKKHAVKMFEAGKLTNEDLDDFLSELKNVNAVRDDSEGEAKRYFDHALILRETVLALRDNSTRHIDLIRCESLHSLDQEIDRFLMKNYFLLVSMAPLSKEVQPITSSMLPHLGPPVPAANSIWFKLFIYHISGCGPPSVLFPRGMRVKSIPKILRKNCDRVLITSWGHEPASLPLSNMIFSLNEALLYSPVLVQSYGRCEQGSNNTFVLPFPFKNDIPSDEKGNINWRDHTGLKKLLHTYNLDNTCGYITLLRTNSHNNCSSFNEKHISPTADDLMEEYMAMNMPFNGVTSEENKLLLREEVDNSERISLSSGDATYQQAPKNAHHLPIVSFSSTNVNDWCLLDCNFGVPLFDGKLNSSICQSIVCGGLWDDSNLEKLIRFNQSLAADLTEFIRKYQINDNDGEYNDDLFDDKDQVPWPVNSLMFNEGKLSELL